MLRSMLLFLASFVLVHLFDERLFVGENVSVPLADCTLVTHPDLLCHLQPTNRIRLRSEIPP